MTQGHLGRSDKTKSREEGDVSCSWVTRPWSCQEAGKWDEGGDKQRERPS